MYSMWVVGLASSDIAIVVSVVIVCSIGGVVSRPVACWLWPRAGYSAVCFFYAALFVALYNCINTLHHSPSPHDSATTNVDSEIMYLLESWLCSDGLASSPVDGQPVALVPRQP